MKKALNKDILRDILKSKGRYFSIMLIVALGVAFFSGIKVSPKVMRNTVDDYYDEYNFMDVEIISTLGLTDDDVKAIKKLDTVEGVFPTYSMDVITNVKDQDRVLKVHALPTENLSKDNKDYINRVKLIKGRLPKNSGECVVLKPKYDHLNLKIGKTLNIKSGTEDKLSENLKKDNYKIVGLVETPYYLSYEFGNSSIGSGSVDGIMLVPQNDFKTEAYTEMYITAKGAKEQTSFYQDYKDTVKKTEDQIDKITDERIEHRYNEVVGEATDELNKAKKEYNDKKKETEDKINKAEKELKDGKQKIKDGKQELKTKKAETKKQIKDGFKKLDSAEAQLKSGRKQYEAAKKEFESKKQQANSQISSAESQLAPLKSNIDSLKSNISGLESQLSNPSISEEKKATLTRTISAYKEKLSALEGQYNEGYAKIQSIKNQIKSGERKLSRTKSELDRNQRKIKTERSKLYTMEEKAEKEFKKAEEELVKNEKKLVDSEKELEKAKNEAKDEFKKAEKDLKEAEDEIKKIEKPEWYVLNRDKQYSAAEYGGCADSIDALAGIFPVFFVLVAALVALTTMTRMVDEQRINIGTLKGLGYTLGMIAKKYIVYAMSASAIGSIIGLIVGYTVFPTIIYNAYAIMYTVPKVELRTDLFITVLSIATSIFVTTFAAFAACRRELIEAPAILMRPKAPKNGKRILLERIGFVWNRIGFIWKVTLRNIFRYKKRFLMTVLGISGCTALILTGFGVRDSIQMIVDVQFGELNKYSMTASYDSDEKTEDVEYLKSLISNEKGVKEIGMFHNQNAKVMINNKEKEVTVVIPENKNTFKEFIELRERKSHTPIKLDNKGIVISEKAARNLDAKVGDKVKILNENDVSAEAVISGITENYVNHYIYMTNDYYKELFNRNAYSNRIYGVLDDSITIDQEDKMASKIIDSTCANGTVFTTGIKDGFSDTIKSLNYVVLLMIVSAGALAFVVLYNLSNVNISERIREIATIKVLGFYDKEVSAYIYRENVILTLIGAVVGLGLGVILHQFIMITVEVENMMFGRLINPLSYAAAFILTIVMGTIVNLVMNKKLKKVEMVESLKSVD
ncbi:FtsX-like permease family protein [Peptacetobacter hiranonis]|uniref:FtsX-like permease family protein n=1 Tax=Peptacetobacter hiranonis TaxID=89152 RepID=UPI002E779BAC|nr:FtsX-like permease family protein [Peptacetobacter hiranonis]MEE0247910.1 FtsX-like permease family protein [Peptacetobacter hiranonis]